MLSQLSAKATFKGLAVTVLSSTLLACASNPDNIDAAYVSAFKYEPYSCEQISFELGFVARRTQALYDTLRSTRRHDNWQAGVGVILLPTLFALEGGDGVEASEYAFLKGEFEALQYASMQKRCGFASVSPDVQIEEALAEDTVIILPDNRRVSLSQMLGLLEQAYAQQLITEQELQAAQDTAFMLLGSDGDGRNLPAGALDNLYALINELELALPMHEMSQIAAAEPGQTSLPPRTLAPAAPASGTVTAANAPRTPRSLDALVEQVETLEPREPSSGLQSIQLIEPRDPAEAVALTGELIPQDGMSHAMPAGPKTLESILHEYADLENYYVGDLPQWKLVRFFDKAGIANTTPVLAYIDTTLWGSGANGVVFTPEGIYYSNDFVAGVGGTYFISYADVVQHAVPNFNKRYFYLGYGALPKRGLIDFVGNDTDLDGLLGMIEEIQAHYKSPEERFPMALAR